jgi:hypothetical protein
MVLGYVWDVYPVGKVLGFSNAAPVAFSTRPDSVVLPHGQDHVFFLYTLKSIIISIDISSYLAAFPHYITVSTCSLYFSSSSSSTSLSIFPTACSIVSCSHPLNSFGNSFSIHLLSLFLSM